jgi:hypothetical protein
MMMEQTMGRRLSTNLRWSGAVVVVLLGAGCATLQEPEGANLESASAAVRQCAQWFRDLDLAVDGSGVRDAGAYRIPGFPYLRTDRYAASFRDEAKGNEAVFSAWLRRLRSTDAVARRAEIRNLPAAELPAFADGGDSATAVTERCAAELERHEMREEATRARLLERAVVPNEYVEWQRAAGLYPLLAYPFAQGIERWHEEARAAFRASRSGGPRSATPVTRYLPSGRDPMPRNAVAALLSRAGAHPLGDPEFSEQELERLFATYAPVFEVETGGAFDRPGALAWNPAEQLEVDTTRPVVYRRAAYTRNGKDTLLQLVYTLWFPERPAGGAFDVLAGKLDGIVLRVTLAPDGEPVLYDSIHPCGCYHMFFPTPRARATPAPEQRIEWAFVPAVVPALAEGERLVVRVATRTHYLVDVATGTSTSAGVNYAFEDEDSLRSLPLAAGGYRSIYAPSGLVAGTERGERALFWPMGIPSAGAMRQWGKHATAFLGKRHFDDPDLIERRFLIAPAAAAPMAARDGSYR